MSAYNFIPNPNEAPVYTKTILHKGYFRGKECLIMTRLLADNDGAWTCDQRDELGIHTTTLMKNVCKDWDPNGDHTDFKEILDTDIPKDLTFRDAWRYDKTKSNGIGIDIADAKNSHKAYIRAIRDQKIIDLDVQFQRALEVGADTSDIVTKKQILRDLPAQVDSLNVTETTVVGISSQIKAVWNDDLLGAFPYNHGAVVTTMDDVNTWEESIGVST
tara:strand:+ start:8382 stop:9032 length:651 start_codon:yes stop_codon:yes gene_type:complete